jgi:hypothetical protein
VLVDGCDEPGYLAGGDVVTTLLWRRKGGGRFEWWEDVSMHSNVMQWFWDGSLNHGATNVWMEVTL